MDDVTRILRAVRDLFFRVAETGAALIALIVVVYILLGAASGDYVISVVANLSLLIDAVSSQTLIAVVLIAGLIFFARRRG